MCSVVSIPSSNVHMTLVMHRVSIQPFRLGVTLSSLLTTSLIWSVQGHRNIQNVSPTQVLAPDLLSVTLLEKASRLPEGLTEEKEYMWRHMATRRPLRNTRVTQELCWQTETLPKTASHVCALAWQLYPWESQWCIPPVLSLSFPGPCKMPRCHTTWFYNVILTPKWETVLGKYRGYWFSQSKRDDVKIACLVSLCPPPVMGVNFSLHKRFTITKKKTL